MIEKEQKKGYIEYIRAAATAAVVLIHVVTLMLEYSTPAEIGMWNYAFFSACHMAARWAVPCFLMVSGALLLPVEKEIDFWRIKRYVFRMLGVLLTFGVAYALMELVFTRRTITIGMLGEALLNTAQGQSWAHLWYVYMLIGLYLITIPLKCVIEKLGEKGMRWLLAVLLVGNILIPSVNAVFGISLSRFMVLDEYVTYYLLGWWFSTRKWDRVLLSAVTACTSTGAMILLEIISIFQTGTGHPINTGAFSILVLIQSASIFLLVKATVGEGRKKTTGVVFRQFCACSFGIYLIHPFFLNLVYKAAGINPLSLPMPVYLGTLVMWIVMLALAFAAAEVMKKIPVINKML